MFKLFILKLELDCNLFCVCIFMNEYVLKIIPADLKVMLFVKPRE